MKNLRVLVVLFLVFKASVALGFNLRQIQTYYRQKKPEVIYKEMTERIKKDRADSMAYAYRAYFYKISGAVTAAYFDLQNYAKTVAKNDWKREYLIALKKYGFFEELLKELAKIKNDKQLKKYMDTLFPRLTFKGYDVRKFRGYVNRYRDLSAIKNIKENLDDVKQFYESIGWREAIKKIENMSDTNVKSEK